MGTLVIIAQLILALAILVVLHELGHFIPAKLFKIKVEKFYLFFNPWFSLFKIKKGDTEYGIGWLPLGGYVKIAGMIHGVLFVLLVLLLLLAYIEVKFTLKHTMLFFVASLIPFGTFYIDRKYLNTLN